MGITFSTDSPFFTVFIASVIVAIFIMLFAIIFFICNIYLSPVAIFGTLGNKRNPAGKWM